MKRFLVVAGIAAALGICALPASAAHQYQSCSVSSSDATFKHCFEESASNECDNHDIRGCTNNRAGIHHQVCRTSNTALYNSIHRYHTDLQRGDFNTAVDHYRSITRC